jgi:hypothetical protein
MGLARFSTVALPYHLALLYQGCLEAILAQHLLTIARIMLDP